MRTILILILRAHIFTIIFLHPKETFEPVWKKKKINFFFLNHPNIYDIYDIYDIYIYRIGGRAIKALGV